jgi:superfamily II DNA or RNA helicase
MFPKKDLNDNSAQSAVQREALAAGLRILADHDRARFTMACGVGKTFLQLKLAEALSAIGAPRHTRVLVLVPTLALVRQSRDEWMRDHALGARFDSLCVCSDPSLKGGILQDGGIDEIQLSPEELAELGVAADATATFDIARINGWLDAREAAGVAGGGAFSVVFSTYQSAAVVGMAMAARRAGNRAIDICVFDEAHKTAGEGGKAFAFGLSDDNIEIRKRLFFTATERVLAKAARNDDDEDTFLSMDDPEVYGPRAYAISFREAADRGIILPYEIIITVIRDKELAGKRLAGAGVRARSGESIHALDIANMSALRQVMEKFRLKKAITFHRSVAGAKRFADLRHAVDGARLDGTNGFWRMHVNGRMPHGTRREQMRLYADEGGRRVITNARCLTEGINVPATDLVAFMDSKGSTVDIVQAVGRTLRRSPGKSKGYVLLPLHVSYKAGESDEDALERSAPDFKHIREVLAALAEGDDVLTDEIQRVASRVLTPGGGGGSTLGDLPFRVVMTDGSGAEVRAEHLARAVAVRLIKGVAGSWEEGFAHLKKYVELNGHADVPQDFKSGIFSLGQWLAEQRKTYKKGNYPADRLERMSALGVKWDVLDAAWEVGFAHLKTYFEQYGHAYVPQDFKSGMFSLGQWLSGQGKTHKKGNYPTDRLERMNALGVKWDMRYAAATWEEGFAHFKKYAELNGHADVPRNFRSGKFQLGQWLSKQREIYKKGNYPADRLERMSALKVKWRVLDTAWEEGFSLLKAYFDLNGHADVPKRFKSGDYPLGQWLADQRKTYKNGNYPAGVLERMNALGVKWPLKKQD